MTALRFRDKLFVVVVVPAALLSAYVYFWRAPYAAKVKTDTESCAKLMTPENFAAEKQKCAAEKQKREKLVADSAAELDRENKTPTPEAKIAAAAGDTVAARERAVFEVFRDAGLRIVSSEVCGDGGGARGGGVLRATAYRPSPRARRYRLEGSYSAVKKALELIVERKCAVIPERLEMNGGENWTVFLWF